MMSLSSSINDNIINVCLYIIWRINVWYMHTSFLAYFVGRAGINKLFTYTASGVRTGGGGGGGSPPPTHTHNVRGGAKP